MGDSIIRTPLKDLNTGRTISSREKKDCMEMKRKKTLKKLSNDRTIQGTLLNFLNIGNSSKQSSSENKDNSQDEENECLDGSKVTPDHSDTLKYTMFRVNRFFMEDLKCPEFSPFSQISYSCSSASSCEYENHKIIAEQISETQEKALTFLAKSWYVLKYPLTCLINERTYLSPFVLRFLFYGIIDEKDENICLRIKDIIKGHLKLHPPCNKKLRNLYCNVLVGEIDNVDPSNPEIVTYNFKNILKLIDKTINDINNKPNDDGVNLVEEDFVGNKSFEIPENIDDFYQFFSDNYKKTGNILPSTLISSNNDFEEDRDKIDSRAVLKRLFFVFSLMVDILEENFRMWWMRSRYCLRNKIRSESSFPIIVKIAWEDIKDRNSLNEHCIEVFDLFSSCPKEYKLEIARYITLLSEVVRASEENKEMKFPFFGVHCNRFAKELSNYVKTENGDTVSNIQLIHPTWLKFKVIGFILKSELTSNGVDDLNSIVKIIKRNLSLRPKAVSNRGNQRGISKKNLNLKNNKCDTSGETVIHKYCRMNNHKALGVALRSKDVNVNIADNAGWTPLHNVAHYNSVDCLKLLIKHRLPAPAGAEELNIFSLNSDNDTPLSCAVKIGNDKVVDILLSSGAGVTVWNTVSSGCSAVQLAKSKQMEEALIKGWETSTSLYRNLNMTPLEVDLIYHMTTSFCKLYHIREYSVTLDPKSCKPDSHYNFDYIQYCKDENTFETLHELIDKLSTCRSNPKNLKMILFYLQCKIK